MINALAISAILVTLIGGGVTNRCVEIADSKLYYGWEEIEAESYLIYDNLSGGTGVNFDCVTSSGIQATLVSPTNAIGCAHLHYNVGDSIVFGDEDAIVSEVLFDAAGDLSFLVLDRALTVQPCIVAPVNWMDYVGVYAPYIGGDRTPAVYVNNDGEFKDTRLSSSTRVDSLGIRDGDSGSPVFLVHRGQPVFIGVIISMTGTFQPINFELIPLGRGFIINNT